LVIHDNGAARPHDGPDTGNGFIVDRYVQVFFRYASARRATKLHRLEFSFARNAPADIVDHGAQGGPHGDFHQADVVDVAGKGENFGSLARLRSHTGIPGPAVADDLGDVGQGLHVVQDGRLVPQPFVGREWRPWARHAAAAFNGSHQGGFFTAHKGAGTLINFDFKIEAGAEDVGTEQAIIGGLLDGNPQPFDRQGVFGAAVDISLVGVDGPGCDDHPLDNSVGVGFQNAAVHEGSRITFVRITEDILDLGIAFARKFPFQTGGETGSSPPPDAGG